MAVTLTLGTKRVPGSASRVPVTIQGDNSYPNPAGYVVTAAQLGLNRITKIDNPIAATVASGVWDPVVVPTYLGDGTSDMSQFALHLIVNTTGVEVANAVNVTNANFILYVEGN